jgi:hypothetical protein
MMDERYAELQALICEREGMIAENVQRKHLGQSMAYQEDSFLIIAEKIRTLYDKPPIIERQRCWNVFTGNER